MSQPISFKGTSLVRANIRNGIVGIVVGIVINVIFSASNNRIIPTKNIFINILFSLFISLSITNSVVIYEKFLRPEKYTAWKYLLSFYACNMVGMIIGTELAYLIVSLLFRAPYEIADHLGDYRFNFFIVMVVGTLLLLFRVQEVSLISRIKDKEVELTRTNQLKAEAELEALQSKINPHFLYNALNSIAGLIHLDQDKAEEMTLNLSKLFRYSINQNKQLLSSVSEELEVLEAYVAIEEIRFGERLQIRLNIAKELYALSIPRFLIQPLVENAIKHGLKDTTGGGMVSVAMQLKAGKVEVSVFDSGIPFPNELRLGYGLQSTYEKLALVYIDQYEIQFINLPKKELRIVFPLITKAPEHELENTAC